MRAIVFADQTEVGRVNLGPFDPSMGVYGGVFEPSPEYAQISLAIRRLTCLIVEAPASDPRLADAFAARDRLKLRVQAESGVELHPLTVHIIDATDVLPDEEVVIELLGVPWEEAERIFGA